VKIKRRVTQCAVPSTGADIHLDVYRYPGTGPATGTVQLAHGIAGHGRLLSPFGLALMKHCFHVICPDLAGYGFSEGRRGDWTRPQSIANLQAALT